MKEIKNTLSNVIYTITLITCLDLRASHPDLTGQVPIACSAVSITAALRAGEKDLVGLERLSNQGDTDACCQLGKIYAKGKGAPKDTSLGYRLLRQAADRGHAEAMYQLGKGYMNSYWSRSLLSFRNAQMRWFRKAAAAGHPKAQYWVAEYMDLANRYGDPLPEQEQREALGWLRASAQQRYPCSQLLLSDYVPSQERFSLLLDLSQSAFQKSSDQDIQLTAQCAVGMMYVRGEGVEKNMEKGIQCLKQAAATGDPASKRVLGLLAEQEEWGVTIQDAIELYKSAAAADDWQSMKRLGIIYQDGRESVPQDIDLALSYYRAAYALEGLSKDYDFLYRFGCLLISHSTEPDDLAISFHCFRKIHYNRLLDAQIGREIGPGYPDLEYRLGKMCEEGRGTNQDDGQAAYYYKIAARKGHGGAKERLDALHGARTGFDTSGKTQIYPQPRGIVAAWETWRQCW